MSASQRLAAAGEFCSAKLFNFAVNGGGVNADSTGFMYGTSTREPYPGVQVARISVEELFGLLKKALGQGGLLAIA